MAKTSSQMQLLLIFLLSLILAPSLPAQQGRYEWKHEPGVSLSLTQEQMPVWTYHLAPPDDTPYFDPVCAPGGTNLVVKAPKDHLWHRGLWFSWKYINDVNFWDWTEAHGNRPKWPANPPHLPDGWTKMQGKETFVDKGDTAVLEMTIGYGQGETLWIKEARRIAFTKPVANTRYIMDWSSTFTAVSGKMVFDRTPPKPTTGGYAGLGLRAPSTLKDVVFTNSLGTTGQDCRSQKAAWVDMTAVANPQSGPEGVTIFDHPANPRHPTPWHVQATPPFYYFNPAPLYNEPLTLEQGKSFTLRYRILVHHGKIGAEELNKEFEAYGKEK